MKKILIITKYFIFFFFSILLQNGSCTNYEKNIPSLSDYDFYLEDEKFTDFSRGIDLSRNEIEAFLKNIGKHAELTFGEDLDTLKLSHLKGILQTFCDECDADKIKEAYDKLFPYFRMEDLLKYADNKSDLEELFGLHANGLLFAEDLYSPKNIRNFKEALKDCLRDTHTKMVKYQYVFGLAVRSDILERFQDIDELIKAIEEKRKLIIRLNQDHLQALNEERKREKQEKAYLQDNYPGFLEIIESLNKVSEVCDIRDETYIDRKDYKLDQIADFFEMLNDKFKYFLKLVDIPKEDKLHIINKIKGLIEDILNESEIEEVFGFEDKLERGKLIIDELSPEEKEKRAEVIAKVHNLAQGFNDILIEMRQKISSVL